MPQRSEAPQQARHQASNQYLPRRPRRRHLLYLACAGLAVMSLACAVFGSGADEIAIRRRLPTLTRTPLPTLTPTANAAQMAIAAAVEPVATASSPHQAPAEAAPVEVEVTQAETTPGAGHVVLDATAALDTAANSVPAAPVDLVISNSDASAPAEAVSSTSPPAPTATATLVLPTDTPTPVPLPTETPLPTSTPTETPIPLPEGWVFSGVQPLPGPGGRYLLVHGILFNNTGSTQTLNEIKGSFPDDPVLAGTNNYRYYYPVPEVPQGSWIPFKLLIMSQTIEGNFELQAVASEGGDSPRQDFEYVGVNSAINQDKYCVNGQVRNTGAELSNYLVIAAVLYDSEDNVINYYEHDEESPQGLVGDQVRDVSICVDPLNKEVARYELQAWGL